MASAVRICRNFGIASMRVVAPEVELDPYRIEGVAHNTAEFISRIRVFDTLEPALADCVHAMVLTGRERAAKRRVIRPREAAPELLEWGRRGPVALVAGREDHGLTQRRARPRARPSSPSRPTRPTPRSTWRRPSPSWRYELWTAAGGDAVPFKAPRRDAPPATLAEHELLFADWERDAQGDRVLQDAAVRQRDAVPAGDILPVGTRPARGQALPGDEHRGRALPRGGRVWPCPRSGRPGSPPKLTHLSSLPDEDDDGGQELRYRPERRSRSSRSHLLERLSCRPVPGCVISIGDCTLAAPLSRVLAQRILVILFTRPISSLSRLPLVAAFARRFSPDVVKR